MLQGWLLAVLFAAIGPVGAKALMSFKTGRRRAAFEGQLSDMLMSLSGSLRAGHSIAHSMRTASVEMPAPMGEELARIVNEAESRPAGFGVDGRGRPEDAMRGLRVAQPGD